MLRFLLSILKSVLVTIISILIIVSIFIVIGISSSVEEVDKIKENTLLEISLSEKIIDKTSEFDFDFSSLNNESSSLGLDDILISIDKAKYDDKIKGIYLNIDMVNASMATLEEIRDKLQEFKDSWLFGDVVVYDFLPEKILEKFGREALSYVVMKHNHRPMTIICPKHHKKCRGGCRWNGKSLLSSEVSPEAKRILKITLNIV